MKFSEKFGNNLNNVADAVDSNKFLGAIKETFSTFMPFIIVGSFATLFNSILCSKTSGLAQFGAFSWLANIAPAFTAINFATMSCMTLSIVFILGMKLAKKKNLPEHITGLVALASYICIAPQAVDALVKKVVVGSAVGLSGDVLGAQGLFVGMIITILAVELFSSLCKIDKIKIKMPNSVPPAIATSFNTLIPIMITLIIVSICGNMFKNLTGKYLTQFIYSVLQAPLEVVFQSAGGIIAIVIISQLFWFLGIHGGLIVSPIRNPLMAAAIAANTAAFAAGKVPNQPITMGFWATFIVAGGAGITLSLIFAILIFSKRDDHKMIAKLGLLPGICGISEPVVFGLPLVLNPTFAIPFILNSGIATGIALLAVKIGFITCNVVDAPFGLPIFLNAFIGYGWQGVVVQIIILVVATILWVPFVLISNKQKVKEQA